MRLIIEGPDGAGKTTLIGALLEQFPEAVLQPRRVSKEGQPMVDLAEVLQEDLDFEKNFGQMKQLRVFDRHALISGPIYADLLFDEVQHPWNKPYKTMSLTARFQGQPNFYIFCLPGLGVVQESIATAEDPQPEAFSDPDIVAKHYHRYNAIAFAYSRLFPERVMTYDYTRGLNIHNMKKPIQAWSDGIIQLANSKISMERKQCQTK